MQDENTKHTNDQALLVIKLEEQLKDVTFMLKTKDDAMSILEQERNRIKEAYELLTLPSSKDRAQVRPSIHLSSALGRPSSLPVPPPAADAGPNSSDAKLVEILRSQIADMTLHAKKLEDEKKLLQGSLAHRDTGNFTANLAILPKPDAT